MPSPDITVYQIYYDEQTRARREQCAAETRYRSARRAPNKVFVMERLVTLLLRRLARWYDVRRYARRDAGRARAKPSP